MFEHNFFATEKIFGRPNGTHEICVLEENECIFKKEKLKKLTSVLHRLWSTEKTTLQKANFSKTPRFALKESAFAPLVAPLHPVSRQGGAKALSPATEEATLRVISALSALRWSKMIFRRFA